MVLVDGVDVSTMSSVVSIVVTVPKLSGSVVVDMSENAGVDGIELSLDDGPLLAMDESIVDDVVPMDADKLNGASEVLISGKFKSYQIH